MKERIRKLREYKNLNRSELAELTKTKAKTWANIEQGLQKVNEDHIQALIKIWPEYKYWLIFNETNIEAGQISPELEETRQNLKTGTE
jgi:transcriptional regulator with XRE-family HTH domain